VLWDTGEQATVADTIARLRSHADSSLPLIDIGCGNGRQARALAAYAPRVIGLDQAPAAIERTRFESAEIPDLEFRVADATNPILGTRLSSEFGEANVHLRGVLHIVSDADRAAIVDNLATMIGRRGTVYLCETDVPGDPLAYLLSQGATPRSMPDALRRCVVAGLRPPRHFGRAELDICFPPDRWRVLDAGPTRLLALSLRDGSGPQQIPGFFAVLRSAG
jgi:SAM-dependent methyltransferase